MTALEVFAKLTGVDPTSRLGPAADGDALDLVEDVWFASDTELRLRVSSRKSDAQMRFYQADRAAGGLVEIGALELKGDGALFADAATRNPFLPILVAVSDGSAGVLAFPSLCRGGAHYGELRVLAEWPSYITALRRVSRALTDEFLGWPDASPFAVGELKIDVREATGAERIFSAAFKQWLHELFALGLTLDETGHAASDKARAHIERRAASEAPARNSGLGLALPADALPTIAALVSRRLSIPEDAGTAVGSYVIADADSGVPRCSVSMPPLNGFLLPLQPADAAIPFPLLTREGGAEGECKAPPLPLAIRYLSQSAPHEASLLFPAAPAAQVLKRSLSGEEKARARICVLVSGEASTFAASLARQTLAAQCEVVAVDGNAAINDAAAKAGGNYLLLADGSIALHDPRTLETLLLLAQEDAVATASCVILRETRFEKGSALSQRSGGLYPVTVSLSGAPSLVFKEIESLAAFPRATYPVVGNSFRLALIRTEVWRQLCGLDARNFPVANHDVDFALRAIKAGYVHLCTSAATASDLGDAAPREQSDVLSLAYLPAHRWQQVFAASAVIRDLR
ncbi:MAG: hypothetical protein JOZ72_18895 [Alphaproteobacteria bacterium]|nr:hypothetical protein [Alphaproteobacteria bacterium]